MIGDMMWESNLLGVWRIIDEDVVVNNSGRAASVQVDGIDHTKTDEKCRKFLEIHSGDTKQPRMWHNKDRRQALPEIYA